MAPDQGERSESRGVCFVLHPTTHGYLFVVFSRGVERHYKKVHRLVLEAFEGPCPGGMEGCHEDGDQKNNRRDNLRWKTRSDNAKDRSRHGTQNTMKEKVK